MRLTWHDAVATTLVGVAVGLETAHLAGLDVPGLSAGRAMTGAILVLGLGACIAGAGAGMASLPDSYARWMAFLGAGAVVSALAGLITGAFSMAAVLTATVLGMWMVTTVRRVRRQIPRVTDEELRQLLDNHGADSRN
jgi:hypothetical protein